MRPSVALLAVSLLLILGIVIGALAMHLVDFSRQHRLHGSHRELEGLHLEELSEMLELTPEQRSEVEGILRRGREEARRLHEEMLPRVRAHTESVHGQIRALLDADQQRRLEEVHARHRSSLEHLYLRPASGAGTGD